MRIKRYKNKKIFITTAIIIASLLVLSVGTAYMLKLGPFAAQTSISKGNAPASETEKQASDNAKQQAVTQANGQNKTQGGSDPSPAPQPIPGSSKSSVSVEIPSALQNSGTIHFSTLILAVTSTGTCTLTLSMSQHSSYSATSGVQPLSSTSTCKGFDVPVDQLAPGAWVATLSFSNDTLQGSTTKNISVQ